MCIYYCDMDVIQSINNLYRPVLLVLTFCKLYTTTSDRDILYNNNNHTTIIIVKPKWWKNGWAIIIIIQHTNKNLKDNQLRILTLSVQSVWNLIWHPCEQLDFLSSQTAYRLCQRLHLQQKKSTWRNQASLQLYRNGVLAATSMQNKHINSFPVLMHVNAQEN